MFSFIVPIVWLFQHLITFSLFHIRSYEKVCFDYCGHIFWGNRVIYYIFGVMSYVLVTVKLIKNWVQMKNHLYPVFQYIVESLKFLWFVKFRCSHNHEFFSILESQSFPSQWFTQKSILFYLRKSLWIIRIFDCRLQNSTPCFFITEDSKSQKLWETTLFIPIFPNVYYQKWPKHFHPRLRGHCKIQSP